MFIVTCVSRVTDEVLSNNTLWQIVNFMIAATVRQLLNTLLKEIKERR